MPEASHCISKYESVSYFCLEPYHLRSRSHPTGSLVSTFVFLLDFLLVVPDIQRKFGKNKVTQVGNLLPEIVISYPNAFEQPSWQPSFRCASLSRNPWYVDYGSGACVFESRRVHASAQELTKGNGIRLFRVLGQFLRAFCYM